LIEEACSDSILIVLNFVYGALPVYNQCVTVKRSFKQKLSQGVKTSMTILVFGLILAKKNEKLEKLAHVNADSFKRKSACLLSFLSGSINQD
jgi:hypothetical protein